MPMTNDTFLRACRGESTAYTPVWYMRQAGRYDADYRAIREHYSLVEICQNPELCYTVTKMPIDKLGVDAAILFSDIMIPIGAMGLPFEIKENVGPIIASPIRSVADVSRLQIFDAEESLPYVLESIRMLSDGLDVPLIGFTGGPFTLASYMIEGGPSRDYSKVKTMMYSAPDIWTSLMDKLGDMIISYGTAQVRAGAKALQFFDSWVGSLAPSDFRRYVFPTMKRVMTALKSLDVPLIYFGVTTGELLSDFKDTGASVIGVDWRVPLQTARQKVGPYVSLQGNLDPIVLLAPWAEIEERVKDILAQGTETPGYIFNLGHGVKPSLSVDTLKRLTQFVHEYSSQLVAGR